MEDFGVLHTAVGLRVLLVRHPEYIREQDLGKLVDAATAEAQMLFVPTMEEMVEAAKVIRPELPWTLSYPEDGEYE